VTPDLDVVAYCRIGERSAHTWFVLHELLGYPRVRNYDGSWTEWGSMVGSPSSGSVPAPALPLPRGAVDLDGNLIVDPRSDRR
jgi:hypothetical protein